MERANVATYLDPYGYKAAGPSDWRLAPGKSPGVPTLKLAVNGHGEHSKHTFYALRCQLTAAAPSLSLEWHAQRRLNQLREELHDIVKSELGDDYGPVFSKAPFAKRGGPSGTTERLQKWLEALAACVNEGVAPPTLVAQVLRFLEAPERELAEASEDHDAADGIASDCPVYWAETPTSMRSRRSGSEPAEAPQRERSASPGARGAGSPARFEGSEPSCTGAAKWWPETGEPSHTEAPKRPAEGLAPSPMAASLRQPEAPSQPAGGSPTAGSSPAAGASPTAGASPAAGTPTAAAPAASLPEPSASSTQGAEQGAQHDVGSTNPFEPAAGRSEVALPAPEAAPAARGPSPLTSPTAASVVSAPGPAAAAPPALGPAALRSAGLGEEEEEPSVGSDMVSLYLAPFGYMVANPEEWQQTPKRSFGTPTLALSVNGHEERDSHTYYDVHCWFVAKRPSLHLEWLAMRRLATLREELHDIVKNELGKSYSDVFAKAPFAKRGGFSGTTLRLQRWLEVLAASVNDGTAPPALVAQVLLFLGAPAQTEHHSAAGSTEARPQPERIGDAGGGASSHSRARSSSATRRSSRSGVETFTLGGELGLGQARAAASQLPLPRRELVDMGCSSCDEAAEATTDDEGPVVWSVEKRRAGYEKLREWFKELRRRLESRVKRQSTSMSPRRSEN